MKKVVFIAIVGVIALIASLASAQSGKDAYKALKKVQIRMEAGLNYKDSSTVLSDAKTEVELFLEGSEAKQKPELAAAIKKAMTHYENAIRTFRFDMEILIFGRDIIRGPGGPKALDDSIEKFENEIFGIYPDARATCYDPTQTSPLRRTDRRKLVNYISRKGDEELEEAKKFFIE